MSNFTIDENGRQTNYFRTFSNALLYLEFLEARPSGRGARKVKLTLTRVADGASWDRGTQAWLAPTSIDSSPDAM